jgi:WD40 repeat protein
VGYDGFISYSHAADGRLAPALQRGLQRLAKRWNSRRALHVFRDETGLSTNPHLWSAIENALDDSDWFVLLASPESASSEWVNKEVAHWVATKPVDHILPVVTDGTWEWDASSNDFTADSTSVPPALRGALREEARHLDLRWARDETDLDLRNSRFRGAIADLAAPMHGIAKDDLEGEDIRQQKRAQRLARGGTTIVVLLLVISLVFGALAASQRNQAQHQRNEANQQRDLAELATDDALAGGLTAKVDSLLGAGQYDLALLLAVEANNAASHLPPSSPSVRNARDALLHAVAAQPTLQHTLSGLGGKLASVVYSPDGKTIVAQSTSGAVRVWDATTGVPSAHQPPTTIASFTGMALNDAGLLALAAATNDGAKTATPATLVWDLKTDRPWRWQPPPAAKYPTFVALSDNGLLAAGTQTLGGYDPTASTNSIDIWNLNTGRRVGRTITVAGSVDALRFARDGTRLGADVVTPDGSAIDLELIDATTGRLERRFVAHGASTAPSPNTHRAFDPIDAAFFDAVVFSLDGKRVSSVVARAKDGDIATFDATTGARVGGSPPTQNETIDGVSPDLRELVVQSPHSDKIVDAATGSVLASYPRDNTSGIAVNPIAVDPAAPNVVYQPSQQGSLAVLNWSQLGPPHFLTAASTRRLDFPVFLSPAGQLLHGEGDTVDKPWTFSGPAPSERVFASPSGYTAVLSNDNIVIRDPRQNRAVRTLTDVPTGCTSLFGYNFVFIGTPADGRVVLDCPAGPTGVFAKATLRSWDLSEPRSTPQWQENWSIPVQPGFNIPFLVASADGNTIGVMGDGNAQVVDGRTGRLMASGPVISATASGGQLERLALSPDARTIATIDYSGSVELLDTTTGKLRQTLTSSTGLAENPGLPGFPELAFSPDGNYLAVWDNPIGVEVWDLHTGASVGVFDGRTTAPPFTSFGRISGFDEGPYSQFVVSFSAPDNSVTVTGERATSSGASSSFVRTATWSLTPSDWERAACTIVGRDLTTDEWNQYVGTAVPYHHTCTSLLASTSDHG